MTWDGLQERRRTPRVAVDDEIDCRFEMRTRVRLVDISASGALLVADAALPIDTPAQLRAVLVAGRFAPSLKVRRSGATSTKDGTQLGTLFDGMDDESRQSLEAFLQKTKS